MLTVSKVLCSTRYKIGHLGVFFQPISCLVLITEETKSKQQNQLLSMWANNVTFNFTAGQKIKITKQIWQDVFDHNTNSLVRFQKEISVAQLGVSPVVTECIIYVICRNEYWAGDDIMDSETAAAFELFMAESRQSSSSSRTVVPSCHNQVTSAQPWSPTNVPFDAFLFRSHCNLCNAKSCKTSITIVVFIYYSVLLIFCSCSCIRQYPSLKLLMFAFWSFLRL